MLKRMFPYMHKYRKYLWLSCFCVVAETVFELVIPLLMADIIDVGVANQDKTCLLYTSIPIPNACLSAARRMPK